MNYKPIVEKRNKNRSLVVLLFLGSMFTASLAVFYLQYLEPRPFASLDLVRKYSRVFSEDMWFTVRLSQMPDSDSKEFAFNLQRDLALGFLVDWENSFEYLARAGADKKVVFSDWNLMDSGRTLAVSLYE